jgi:hypothetical protein
MHEGISTSFRTGCLERELQMSQLPTTRCSCNAILWASLVSFAAINLCAASQRVFIFVVHYVIDSDRKLLDTLSYMFAYKYARMHKEEMHIHKTCVCVCVCVCVNVLYAD